jgi:hypothetical protein
VKLFAQSAAVLGALALVLLSAGTDSVQGGTFTPSFKLELVETAPESSGDTRVDFDLQQGDVNFAAVVAYIPKEWGIVTGDTIQVGAQVGYLSSDAVLGLLGGSCNTVIPVEFDMLNATIDKSETVSFEDLDGNTTRDFADDTDDDGIPNAVEMWPEFIDRLFEGEDNPGYPLQPIRRSAAYTIVASTPVLLQFLVFEPGTLIDKDIPTDVNMGFPSVTLLQNAGDPEVVPEPGPITDFCTPLKSHNETFGISKDNEETTDVDESGTPLQMTPTDGKYVFTGLSFGQRDADGDGLENSFDTCPYVDNVGDPRIQYDGDLDNDGLDAACDPLDDAAAGGTNSDQDGDGYLNRQDNCPLLSNGEDTTNQHDNDRDQIGDVCDTTPGVEDDDTTADGELIESVLTQEVNVGAGGTGPGQPPSEEKCPDCWREGWVPEFDGTQETDEPSGPTETDDGGSPTATDDETNGGGDDDGGGIGAGVIAAIVVAAVVVVGGAGFLLMRRRGA